MNARPALAAALLGVLTASLPAAAHHSFQAEFDANRSMTASGICTKVEWMNPHAHFRADVKGNDGNVTNWDFELASPNVLLMQGWQRDSLKAGDPVTVEGFLAKDGTRIASARRVTLPDGRKVFAGSTAASQQPK
jgi:hypothetical protein